MFPWVAQTRAGRVLFIFIYLEWQMNKMACPREQTAYTVDFIVWAGN